MRSHENEAIVINRDVQAVIVPDGTPVPLKAGLAGFITQALGGSFTLWVHGQLMRLRGADADAIGKPVPAAPTAAAGGGIEALREQVWQVLRTCYDPEIPVDIVELGLVYVCDVLPMGDDRFRVSIKMTLTAPACGMGEVIADEVCDKVLALAQVARKRHVQGHPWPVGKNGDWQPWLSDPEFAAELAAFLDCYGHRGHYETYLRSPRWSEAPELLLEQLPALAEVDAGALHRRQQAAAAAAWQRIRRELPVWARPLIRAQVKAATRDSNRREAARSALIALLAAGRRLTRPPSATVQ